MSPMLGGSTTSVVSNADEELRPHDIQIAATQVHHLHPTQLQSRRATLFEWSSLYHGLAAGFLPNTYHNPLKQTCNSTHGPAAA